MVEDAMTLAWSGMEVKYSESLGGLVGMCRFVSYFLFLFGTFLRRQITIQWWNISARLSLGSKVRANQDEMKVKTNHASPRARVSHAPKLNLTMDWMEVRVGPPPLFVLMRFLSIAAVPVSVVHPK
ncbi:hypothetical protein C8J56DRAFT_905135 [Mycena floridula]|nr:hypothetical protein C8J56DRAFT_905135 [Mycena floridula]